MASKGLSTTTDATYANDPSDPSVQQHQSDHDDVHEVINQFDYDLMAAATTGQVLTKLGSNLWVPQDPSVAAGGVAAPFVIATPDAPPATRSGSDLDLSGVGAGNIATAIASAVVANGGARPIRIMGDTLDLDGMIDIPAPDFLRMSATDVAVTLPSSMVTTGNTRTAGMKIRGSRTQVTVTITGTTLTGGTKIIPHSNGAVPQYGGVNLQYGDWVQIRSSESHNANRPTQYYKGEINRVLSVSSTQIVLASPLKENYTVASILGIYRIGMAKNPIIEGFNFLANPAATGRQELFVMQWAQRPEILDCRAFGTAAMHGLALWSCAGGRVINPYVEDVNDYNNTLGFEGYGVYIAGSVGTVVSGLTSLRCRHPIDVGSGGSNDWAVPRHTIIRDGHAIRSLAAAWSNHGADDTHFLNLIAEGCGGGVISRGGDTTVKGLRVIGAHADDDVEYNNDTESTTHCIYLGEHPDSGSSDRQGLGGRRVHVSDCWFEVRQGGSGEIPTTHGLYCVDPLYDSDIEFTCNVTGYAMQALGDYIDDVRINIRQDGAAQFSGQGGILLAPGSKAGTAAQYVRDVEIDYRARAIRGTAVSIAGGTNTGTSENCRVHVEVSALGSGATSATAQVAFTSGTHGKHIVDGLVLPATVKASAVTNAGSATVRYTPNRYEFSDGAADVSLATTL